MNSRAIQSQLKELNHKRDELEKVIAALEQLSSIAAVTGESAKEYDEERLDHLKELAEVKCKISELELAIASSTAKEASEAYMQTYRDFRDLATKERDIISRLREAEQLVREIKQEEHGLEEERQRLAGQAKELESTLQEYGLTDFDLTILRKRTEEQPELQGWWQ